MQKILAITAFIAFIASTQASAFWGWDDSDSDASGNYDSSGDVSANAFGDWEAVIDFNFSARARAAGDFTGNADTDGNWAGYGYDYPYYWGGPYGAPVIPPAPSPAPAEPVWR